ncbi:MAG: hypothetical protein ACREH9_03990, partial [Pseudomonadota bacterium]
MAPQVMVAALCTVLAGCTSFPDSYPPPRQRPPVDPPPVSAAPSIVDMSGPAVDAHIVRDVWLGGNTAPWRWTGERPLLTLRLHGTVGLKFVAGYAVPEATFKHTGPVTISFFVNHRLLGAARVEKPGAQRFEKPVSEFWLNPGAEN